MMFLADTERRAYRVPAMMSFWILPFLAFNLENESGAPDKEDAPSGFRLTEFARTAMHWKNFTFSFKVHKIGTERALPRPIQ
jgi:hypothetical protein